MTETFKFKVQIPTLTGGRVAIMLDAWEAWSPPADMPQKARAKLAVNVILDVIKERLRAPLGALIDAHAQAVEDEYALMEGEAPADGDISQPALDWWTNLFEAEAASFEGEVEGMIGASAVMDWVRNATSGSTLADLILAKPIEDNANALAACGVTPQDISELALMGAVPENPPASTEEVSNGPAADHQPRRRSPRTESSSITEAAQAALETLADMGVKDAEVATALGVSRSQVINYRKGTTRLHPDPGQIDALSGVFAAAASRLNSAFKALQSVLSLQELE